MKNKFSFSRETETKKSLNSSKIIELRDFAGENQILMQNPRNVWIWSLCLEWSDKIKEKHPEFDGEILRIVQNSQKNE